MSKYFEKQSLETGFNAKNQYKLMIVANYYESPRKDYLKKSTIWLKSLSKKSEKSAVTAQIVFFKLIQNWDYASDVLKHFC